MSFKKLTCYEKRGSALIITLLVITTLTGMTFGFSEESSIELNLAGFARDGYKARQVARSGVHLTLAVLDQDEDPDMDSLREDWTQFGPQTFPDKFPAGMSVTGKIVDESSKLNINSLINEAGEIDEQREKQLLRLVSILGLEEKIVDPLLDWLDMDDIERLNGAEAYYYQSLEEPYACTNGPLQTIGQLFLVKGIREVNLNNYLTIYSDGKININTASAEVLQSLSDRIDPVVADAIIEYRLEEDFLSVNDLTAVPGIDEALMDEIREWATVKSSAFSFEISGKCQEAVARIKAVAMREAQESRLIYWQVM